MCEVRDAGSLCAALPRRLPTQSDSCICWGAHRPFANKHELHLPGDRVIGRPRAAVPFVGTRWLCATTNVTDPGGTTNEVQSFDGPDIAGTPGECARTVVGECSGSNDASSPAERHVVISLVGP